VAAADVLDELLTAGETLGLSWTAVRFIAQPR
jgi:hypothetical protein